MRSEHLCLSIFTDDFHCSDLCITRWIKKGNQTRRKQSPLCECRYLSRLQTADQCPGNLIRDFLQTSASFRLYYVPCFFALRFNYMCEPTPRDQRLSLLPTNDTSAVS